ncbi:MAG: hypothetical protein ACLFQ5_11020, partial [Oceanicaulis sp.]
GGGWLVLMWIIWAAWTGLTWGAFATRGKPIWPLLSGVEDWSRYILIPTLIVTGLTSLLGLGPFGLGPDGEPMPGTNWYDAKILTYGAALIIGVILRLIMHEWQGKFKILAQGPNEPVEAALKRSIGIGRSVAYLYWVLIAATCFFASVKPF